MSTGTEPVPELVGTKEAAAMFGVRQQNFRRDWARRPDFPKPIATLAATPVWRRDDLERYRERSRPIAWPPRRRRLRLSPVAETWLPEITRRLVERFRPLGIILFGSQARGDADRHSDIDLLVVLPSVTSRREAAGAMYASLEGIPAGTDIHVVSAADVERYHDIIGTIIRPAFAEGTLIYPGA